MSCETKSSQSYSSSHQIPTFGATGNILPSFDKAAQLVNPIQQQNKRSLLSENCSLENKVPDRVLPSLQRLDNQSSMDPIKIDLTCDKMQPTTRNATNFPIIKHNTPGGNNFTDQSVLKSLMAEAPQTRFTPEPKNIVNGQAYAPQMTQSDHYTHGNLSQNQHSTVPKVLLQNSQNSGVRNSQLMTVAYRANELIQQPKDRFQPTRESHLTAIHSGEARMKNQNGVTPVYKNAQQNSYQFNTYGKETNFYQKHQVSGESFMQNNNLQVNYSQSQNYYQVKPREFIDPKSEKVANTRQIQQNSMQQQLLHGRSVVLKDNTTARSAQAIANHRLSQYDCNRMNLNRFHVETQTPNYAQKVNPTLCNRQYQDQNSNAYSLHTALKPMTTTRPMVIAEDSINWSNPSFYEYNNETITERQLQEDIINSVEEVSRVSKYSQYPEAKREIALIKDNLMIDSFPGSYLGFPYTLQEYPSITRKRPNEMSQNQPLKKQVLSTQNSHLNYHDLSAESPPSSSIQFYKDIGGYDVTANSVHNQALKYAPHQSSYNFNNEMNQIVPTSNSVHSSPRSNRNHDSPDDGKKGREDEIDRYYYN